jgi:hypothetical protein
MIDYGIVLSGLIAFIGGIMLLLIGQVLTSIKELKTEIRILQSYDGRISTLEEFAHHFKGCTNFSIK